MGSSKPNLKEYKTSHISFTLGKKIGSGGNGEVYNVDIIEGKQWLQDNWSDFHPDFLVVKFFAVDNKRDESLREERYRRFCREIDIVNEIGDSISGVIPIIDFFYSEGCPKGNDEAWYIMPKARTKRVKRNEKLDYVLKDMLQLARIIKDIHQRDIVHRDIKPDNIVAPLLA